MTIHQRIKELREGQQLTFQALAAKLSVSWQTVQQWEHGKTSPNVKRIQKLAEALNTTKEYLLFGEEQMPSNCTAIVADWPFEIEKSRFDQLPMREKQRAARAIRDIIETWESEHVERRQAG